MMCSGPPAVSCASAPKVHDRGAPNRCAPDLGKIEEIFSVSQVKAGHLIAKALQVAANAYRRGRDAR
jgi:hypothetical protein